MAQPEAARSEGAVRPTTLIEAARLSDRLGCEVTLATETFQRTGSFKFRAAYEVASRVPQRELLTASSGNFGAALACACEMLGKSCIVVMPATSARVKIEAVREYGGAVDLVDVSRKSRAARVAELAREHPEAYVASAYDDPLVIAGNASLGREIARSGRDFDLVVAPVGGGGLTSGIVVGIRESGAPIAVWGAEPLEGNDAARSLAAGRIVRNATEPATIADGARTVSLGENNWSVLREGLAGIVEVPEEAIVEGVRLLFLLANLKAEPTGALPIGAVRTSPKTFAGKRVCCVVSGGNVDPKIYAAMLEGDAPGREPR
jgi:threonine dehydratase